MKTIKHLISAAFVLLANASGTASADDNSNVDFLVYVTVQGESQPRIAAPGEVAGTEGKKKALQSVQVVPGPKWPPCLELHYWGHFADTSDSELVKAPALLEGRPRSGPATFKGSSTRMEGIAFVLQGACADDYDIEYSCHLQDFGTRSAAEGGFCGERGADRRLEAVRLTIRHAVK